jgi:hypothetical protein
MIVVHDGDSLLLVTQNDHAHFSGELLSLWRDDGLPVAPRRDDIVFAGREHDNGWREADSAPRVDAESGEPFGFLSLPAPDRIEIWRRGIQRYRERRPYAALLIHQHAIALHQAFWSPGRATAATREPAGADSRQNGAGDEYAELLDEVRASRDRLLQECGIDEATLLADYPLIQLTDAVSLVACRCFTGKREGDDGPTRPLGRAGRRFWRENGDVVIDPLPLAGATRFRIPCRRIERRRYESDTDLGTALARARWGALEIRVRGSEDRSPAS